MSRSHLRCGSVLIVRENDGFAIRQGEPAGSMGRYPQFRDAIEIPLMLERDDQVRRDLNRLQQCARLLNWNWDEVAKSFGCDDPPPQLTRVA